jgi:hypothetical protein
VGDDLGARRHRPLRLGVRPGHLLETVEAPGCTCEVGLVDELGQLLRGDVRSTDDRGDRIRRPAYGQRGGAVVVGGEPDTAAPQLGLGPVGMTLRFTVQ